MKKKNDSTLSLLPFRNRFIVFHPEARSTKKFKIDFNSGTTRWRTNRADHEKLIKKALGKHEAPLNILDCTAGMLQDTLLFLNLGHKVTAVEQSKILFYLLSDAINRSNDKKIFNALTLVNGNACSYISKGKNLMLFILILCIQLAKKMHLALVN